MTITKDLLYSSLMYSQPFIYRNITLYPILMDKILDFQTCKNSIIVRKNSRFPSKKIIKMSYLEFLVFSLMNPNLCNQFGITDLPGLQGYYFLAIQLLALVCKEQEILYNKETFEISINGTIITPEIFDDLRRVIIIQNDIDFDIDEFINYETEQKLVSSQHKLDKNADKITIEDYVESLCIGLQFTESEVMSMSVRRFWRLIKRFNLHENYTIMRTGECSGMVTFKEPIKHWMISLEEDDKYQHLKANENELKGKING